MESIPVSKEDVKNQLSDVTPSLAPVGATGMRRDHESIDDFEHLEPEPSPVKENAGKGSSELLDKLVSNEHESGRESVVSGAKAPGSQNSSDFSMLSDSKLDSPLADNNTPDMIEDMSGPVGSPEKLDISSSFKVKESDFLSDLSELEKKSPAVQQLDDLLEMSSASIKKDAENLFAKGQDLFSPRQFDIDPKAAALSFMTSERTELMAEGDVPKVEKSGKLSDDQEFLKYESQHEPHLDVSKILKDPTEFNLLGDSDTSPLPAHVRDDIHDDDSFKDTDSLPEISKSSEKSGDIPEDSKLFKPQKDEEFEDGIEEDYDIPGLSPPLQLSDKLEQYQSKSRNEPESEKTEPEASDDFLTTEINAKHSVEKQSITPEPDFTPQPLPKSIPEPAPKPSEPASKIQLAPKPVPDAEKSVPESVGDSIILGAITLVVELVYWRDPKKSGILFGSVLGILLSLSYFSLISVVAYLSLAVLTGTISYRIYKNVMQALQKTSDGHPFKDILELDLTLPQDKVREMTDTAVAHFNAAAAELRRLFLVEDLVDSIKFGILLWCLTYVGSWFNGMTLIIIAFVALFTLPKVYENNKSQIDQNLDIVRSKLAEVTAKVKTFNPIAKKPAAEEKKEN